MSDPPPTPVMPMMAPTPNPLRVAMQSMEKKEKGQTFASENLQGATVETLYILRKYTFLLL